MIQISEELLKHIRAEGEKSYPNECCGILFGKIGKNQEKAAERSEPVFNAFAGEETYHRFLIPPEVLLQAELAARKAGEDIVGFYHSHPDCAAVPSEYDRTHAFPVYSYLIVSVREKRALEVRSFELFEEEGESCFKEERMTEPHKKETALREEQNREKEV